jgi:hypothetical protein
VKNIFNILLAVIAAIVGGQGGEGNPLEFLTELFENFFGSGGTPA